MALPYLSSALRRAPEHRDHEPPPVTDTSEGTEIRVQVEKEIDQFVEKLKNAGIEINEETARIIEEEKARIAEAARDAAREAENKAGISGRRSKAVTTTVFGLSLITTAIASGYAGCYLGIRLCLREIFTGEAGRYFVLGLMLKAIVERPRGR